MDQYDAAPLIATSRAVANLPGLADLLGVPVVYCGAVRWFPSACLETLAACGGVIAWGRKPSATRALAFAGRHGLGLLRLEDGLLRSVGLGSQEPPLSIVVDDLGIYYDAQAPSRLEALIAAPHTGIQQSRASRLMEVWRVARVSKYNYAREIPPPDPLPQGERYVLVADQTLGDASIRYGLADASSFQRMLEAALAENPDCTVLLKVHPEVMLGRKRGHFDLAALAKNPRVLVLGEDVHPVALIEQAEAIYVVTSQMGFEGLLWGKQIRAFGMPFYAGWGLTVDELPAPVRRSPVPLENLVHAALVAYPHYIDPETGQRCEVERVIEWMGLQRRMRERFPADMYALNFSFWKRPVVRSFFAGSQIRFVYRADQVPAGACLAVWGRKHDPLVLQPDVVRLEDGFLRSVGLGAELVKPLSWVIDRRGIYYDSTAPSDLEALLQTVVFDSPLLERASALREAICTFGVTKYNVGNAAGWARPVSARRVILVPGQVETDASIRFGAHTIRRNIDLLKAVRSANPDAYVLYKPHPDVLAGLRTAGVEEAGAERWCNEVIADAPIDPLLNAVDEVHVLTSLAGFEALLRNKRVVAYGQPFYAGWGLTHDMAPIPRRTRRLSLDELVAATLILYPTYVSRVTGRFTTPERALEELLAWRAEGSAWCPFWQRLMARALRKN